MTRKYFGTDGIRGRVGEGNIHPEFVLRLGFAAGRVLGGDHGGKVVIGKDTRISGYMFEAALESGLAAAGMDVYLLGPMPTPAIAYLARTLHASAGIVISASHNPHWDNGIKFFSGRGRKLSDEVELAIEAELERPMVPVESRHIGKAYRVDDAQGRYIEFCKSSVPWEMNLRGLKIVVDCAHGATYHVAPPVFSELGAEVIAIGNQPNGLNINDGCGSTHLGALQKAVLHHGADLGIALDGDGDRVLLVDDRGQEVDGDGILFITARARQRRGLLKGAVVGTQMSNLGLELALKDLGIGFERTKVGDRYIMERLRANEWNLGGEPSGHIICLDRTTTGDGIISALQVLEEMRDTGKTLRELAGGMSHFPQVLRNIRTKGGHDVLGAPAMQKAVADAEAVLGGRGRILLRPSGTEPLLRIMVEGEAREQVETLAKQLEQVALGCLEG